jgi:hypothetical protein
MLSLARLVLFEDSLAAIRKYVMSCVSVLTVAESRMVQDSACAMRTRVPRTERIRIATPDTCAIVQSGQIVPIKKTSV